MAMMDVDLIAPIAWLMNRHVKSRPERIAYSDSMRSVTYKQLADNTAAVAANLAKAGLCEGDRLAIYLPNSVNSIEACFAGTQGRSRDRADKL